MREEKTEFRRETEVSRDRPVYVHKGPLGFSVGRGTPKGNNDGGTTLVVLAGVLIALVVALIGVVGIVASVRANDEYPPGVSKAPEIPPSGSPAPEVPSSGSSPPSVPISNTSQAAYEDLLDSLRRSNYDETSADL